MYGMETPHPEILYLDHAASSPLRPQAREAMAPYQNGDYGNPSGSHGLSRRAKNAVEEARERIAVLLGARPLEIVFTGGGTESDNLAVKGPVFAAAGGGGGGVVATAVEHAAVRAAARFCQARGSPLALAGVDSRGLADPGRVASHVNRATAVASVMLANNETGVIQPVAETAAAVREANPSVAVHTDAVQGFASQPLDVDQLGVDLLTLSAHKFGGPKGAGILYVRDGTPLEPLLHGGGQELGRRSGTHNVTGAVGTAAAMQAAADDRDRFRRRTARERDDFERLLTDRLPGTSITAADLPRVPHISHVRIPGVRNETLLARLDQAGVCASAASACQSGAAAASHVLEAMGYSPGRARECLRFSFGWTTRPGEGEAAARSVAAQAEALR